MKKILLLFLIISCSISQSQNVGIGIINPEPSALLDVSSTSKGFLPPRMSWQQIQSIPSPAAGLIGYDTGIKALRLYTGTEWVILSKTEKLIADAPGGFSETVQSSGGTIYPKAIVMSANKSVYVAGVFNGDANIGSFNLDAVGGGDIFIAKFDSLGVPLWVKTMGSNNTESATGIAIDAADNIYICGFFLSTIDLDPGPGTNSHTTSGSYDGFYARYDLNGNFVWGKKVGGTNSDYVRAIATDGTNVYITGEFSGQASFNIGLLTSAGAYDIFVCRYQSSNGNTGISGWAIKMGGSFDDAGKDIKMNGSNIIVGGYFEGTSNFAGTSKTSYGQEDGFFSVHNAAGTLIDVYQLGGTGNDVVNTVAEDLATSTIFAAGSFSNTADFDDRPAVSLSKTSNGGTDAFIVRYQAGFPFWVNTFGAAANEEIKSMDTDDYGNIYAIGEFSNTVAFDFFNLTSIGGVGVFLLKTEVSGDILWVQQAGGLFSDSGEDVTVSGNGKLLFAGCTIFSNPYLTFNKTKIVGEGFYLARYEE